MTIERLSTNNKYKLALVLALIFFAVSWRILPHPANFAPVAAIAIFAGALLPGRLAISLPLIAMVISDIFIGLHPTIYATWGSFAIIALVSYLRFKKVTPLSVVTASVSASVFFFVVTNFAVWLEGRLYTLDWAGLTQCYVNALPFFRNTLAGDLVFSVGLFGLYAGVNVFAKRIQPKFALR